MSDNRRIAKIQRHTFKPAPTESPVEERIAVALEFLAKEAGDVAPSLDYLNEQMDTLISNGR